MAVDNLKSCYRTLMRFRVDPEIILPVRWYFCPPGALPLNTETAFGSMVWENTDREYPQPGLGEVSLERTWDNGKPPPNVTGLSTPTPIDWFRDGLPADYVWPPPNGEAEVLIDWREEAGCVAGTPALLTDEGALSVLGAEMPDVRAWQFLLFVWPPAIDEFTAFADLQEASFPGYARQTPGWTDPVLSASQTAATYASTLNWVRTSPTGPEVTIFGWAAVGPGLPSLLRSIQLLPAPITLRRTGDNVTLCPVQLLMGICAGPAPIAFTQVCRVGAGAGLHAARVGGRRVVGRLGVGVGPLNAVLIHFAQVGKVGVGAGLHSAKRVGFHQVGKVGVGAGLHSAKRVALHQVGKVGVGAGLHSAKRVALHQVGKVGVGAGLHSAKRVGFHQKTRIGVGVGLHSVPQVGFHQAVQLGVGVGLEADQSPGFEQEGQVGVGVGGTNPQSGSAPSIAFKFGFDFRDHLSYATDPPYAAPVLWESYPHVYTNANGDTITAGWVGGISQYDRDNTVDPRLAGIAAANHDGVYFQVDLPAPGTYKVTLAMGDALGGWPITWQLWDGASFLAGFGIMTMAMQWCDAAGSLWDQTTWPTSNTAEPFMFSSSVLQLVSAGVSSIVPVSHLAVES